MQTECKVERPSETYSKQDRKPDMREHRRTQDSGNDERGGDGKGALRRKGTHGGAQEEGTKNEAKVSIVSCVGKNTLPKLKSMPDTREFEKLRWGSLWAVGAVIDDPPRTRLTGPFM
jgi:hypothetical protein